MSGEVRKGTVLGAGLVMLALASGAAAARADDGAVAGKAVFDQRCKVCHTAEEGGRNGIGPNLFGVFGRPAAVNPKFRFSRAHRECGAVWDEATLDRYLEDVRMVVPKTLKGFNGLKDASERAAVIAYLKSLGGG